MEEGAEERQAFSPLFISEEELRKLEEQTQQNVKERKKKRKRKLEEKKEEEEEEQTKKKRKKEEKNKSKEEEIKKSGKEEKEEERVEVRPIPRDIPEYISVEDIENYDYVPIEIDEDYIPSFEEIEREETLKSKKQSEEINEDELILWINELHRNKGKKLPFRLGSGHLSSEINISLIRAETDLFTYGLTKFLFKINKELGVMPLYESFYEIIRSMIIYVRDKNYLPNKGGMIFKFKCVGIHNPIIEIKSMEDYKQKINSGYNFWISSKEVTFKQADISTYLEDFIHIQALKIWREIEDASEDKAFFLIQSEITIFYRNEEWYDKGVVKMNTNRNLVFHFSEDNYYVREYLEEKNNPTGYCSESKSRIIYMKGCVLQTYQSIEGTCFFATVYNIIRSDYDGKQLKISGKVHKHLIYPARKWMIERHNESLKNGISLDQAIKLQEFLNTDITVYRFKVPGDPNNTEIEILYEPEWKKNPSKPKRQFHAELLIHEAHWYKFIRQTNYFSNRGEYCHQCKKYYKKKHKCEEYTQCPRCKQWFRSLDNHQGNCQISHLNFIALSYFEKYANKQMYANIRFYSEWVGDERVIIYDYETHTKGEYNEHVGYCISVKVKSKNLEADSVFYGYDCGEQFVKYIRELDEGEWTVWGFNNSKYDNHMILRPFIKMGYEPKFILQPGGTLTMMEVILKERLKIKFLDLIRFFGAPLTLEEACKAYGVEIRKGFFPYDFLNEKKDIYYIGKIPTPRYYKNNTVPPDYDICREDWNLKEEVIKYVKNDIEMTYQLYLAMSKMNFELFKVNMNDFVTAQQMAYSIWASTILPNINLKSCTEWNCDYPMPDIIDYPKIMYPSEKLYDMSYAAIYGGRVYPNAREFEIEDYDKIINKEIKYEDITENYAMLLDVCSLYPSAMAFYEYPVGPAWSLNEEQIEELNKNLKNKLIQSVPVGIYKISFKPNPYITVPILPKKSMKKDFFGKLTSSGLEWDLLPGEGCYTSVDINSALESDYYITIIEGMVWDKTYPIFKNFTNLMFKLKQQAENEGNEAKRTTVKVEMNGVYGKFSQKNITEDVVISDEKKIIHEFIISHEMSEVLVIRDDDKGEIMSLILKGRQFSCEEQKPKPNYYSAFILSYSRLIMKKYYTIINPLDGNFFFSKEAYENQFLYGDTDSLIVVMTKEKKEALFPYIKKNELGMLSNDLKKDDGKIIKAIFVGPKTYWIQWIGNDNVIRDNGKCKGIPRKLISPEQFINIKVGASNNPVTFTSWKRTGASSIKNMEPWKIYSVMITRSFLRYFWEGRDFNKNNKYQLSLPYGYGEERNEDYFQKINNLIQTIENDYY